MLTVKTEMPELYDALPTTLSDDDHVLFVQQDDDRLLALPVQQVSLDKVYAIGREGIAPGETTAQQVQSTGPAASILTVTLAGQALERSLHDGADGTFEPAPDLRRGSRVRTAVADFHVDWSFPEQETVSSAEFIHALVSDDFTDTFGKDSMSEVGLSQHPAGRDSFLSLAASDPSGEWLPGAEVTDDGSTVTQHL